MKSFIGFTKSLITVHFSLLLILKATHCTAPSFSHYLVRNSGLKGISFPENRVSSNDKIKVGIIGAGISGLYAATLLQDLNISYEILEASNRIGGRIHTHYFGEETESDYAELGAMHFPPVKEYDRIIGKQNWSLISYLNKHLKPNEQIKLIKFVNNHENNVYLFNGIRKFRSEVEKSMKDVFGFGKSNGGFVDDKYAEKPADFWMNKATDFIANKFKKNFTCGFDYLLKNEWKTFRSWLMDPKNKEFGYPSDVVDWIETMGVTTGCLSHSVLSFYFVNTYFTKPNITVDGGLSKIIRAMIQLLTNKPILNTEVNRIRQSENMNLIVTSDKVDSEYTHLIVTPQFTVLKDIDFDLKMQLKKRIAMRALNYQFAVKIGLHFKTRFWENEVLTNGHPIYGGNTMSDLIIRRTVYPSQAINCTNCRGALLVSYTWNNDAKKYLSYSETDIIKRCLKDLYKIHGSVVFEQFTGRYAIMDWVKNPFFQGGFGLFRPGQTASFLPSLIYPEASGRLHFAGDTLSIYHGWSIGAVISAYRAVKDILLVQGMRDKVKELEERWGTIEEPDFSYFQ